MRSQPYSLCLIVQYSIDRNKGRRSIHTKFPAANIPYQLVSPSLLTPSKSYSNKNSNYAKIKNTSVKPTAVSPAPIFSHTTSFCSSYATLFPHTSSESSIPTCAPPTHARWQWPREYGNYQRETALLELPIASSFLYHLYYWICRVCLLSHSPSILPLVSALYSPPPHRFVRSGRSPYSVSN